MKRGRRRGLGPWLIALPVLAGLWLGLATCAHAPRPVCRYPEGFLYNAAVDSLGLDDFLALPARQRTLREQEAATWGRRAAGATTSAEQVQALRNAAGLAPDHCEVWLELAAIQRWLGHPQAVDDDLLAAAAALRQAPPERREALRFRIAVLQAWIRYDRGQWPKGLSWAEHATAIYGQDRQALLVSGLLSAGAERSLDATATAQDIERQEFFRTDWRWIRGMTEFYQGRLAAAAFYLVDLRPDPVHRAEFWNDVGFLQERLGNWREARRSFQRTLAALPLKDLACLVLCERRAPLAAAGEPLLPVWLAFGRFYATGSLLAYCALAFERFQAATQPADREFWAEAAIRTATICLRKQIGEPWTRSWRGQTYAELSLDEQAETDLRAAVAAFREMGRPDAPTLTALGQILLKQQRYTAALPLLEQARDADSTLALAWSGLGLARIMTQDLPGAAQALDRSLALDPTLAVSWYNRGLMHFHAQQWQEAVRDLEHAAKLAPHNPDILQILQRARLMEARQQRGEPAPP